MISGRRPKRPDGQFYRQRRKGHVRIGSSRRSGMGNAVLGLMLAIMSKVLRRR